MKHREPVIEKTPWEAKCSTNDVGDLVVDFFERREIGNPTQKTPVVSDSFLQEVRCVSYESRIRAIADIQFWVLYGEMREYENDYQRNNVS